MEKLSDTNGNVLNNDSQDVLNDNSRAVENKKETMEMHWNEKIPRIGLGSLIKAANHIAITVADVGNSLWFYSEVMGFQQIRRPNFDRHGAWLTIGNIELHLILGNPMVHSGDDLIVSHLSVETTDIKETLRRLKEMDIPFETNVSVPKGNENEGVVTQFFLRDPDGYYIEICNCGILTDFCLGDDKPYLEGYMEGVKPTVSLAIIAKLIQKAEQAKKEKTR